MQTTRVTAEGYRIGEAAWWEAVKATERANTEHMEEEEQGPLIEFDDAGRAKARAEFIEGVETLLIQAPAKA